MRIFSLSLVLILAAPAAWAQKSEEDEAGDVSEVDKDDVGPLRERIRPVSGHVFRKGGRFELSPSATVSVKDAFFTKYIFGLSANYHFSEAFALGARFGYSLPIVSGAAQICRTTGDNLGCELPKMTDLDGTAPGQITLTGGVDLQWAPIYGKIALVSEAFLHFDMYAILGASFIQYQGPLANNAPRPSLLPDGTPSSPLSEAYSTIGANAGVGIRFFAARWLAVRVELRDLVYMETARPDDLLRNQILFELGLSMFLPTSFNEN